MDSGWIILDKPTGMFSRRAGGIVARVFGVRTFGHIGTLDEMASGVLPIALGGATKMIPFVEESCPDVKEYEFALKFGFETDTLDVLGHEVRRDNIIPSRAAVIAATKKLIGDTEQVPPMFSAIHVGGVRAYDLARLGKIIDMPPRVVHIDVLDLLSITDNEWTFRTRCSRGTYVRAIARDIAAQCGAIATVTMIRRTESIGFSIKNTVRLDFLEKLFNNGGDFRQYLKPVDFGLGDIPVQNLDRKSAELYRNGGFINIGGVDGLCRVYSDSGFIGIGYISDGVLRPKRTI